MRILVAIGRDSECVDPVQAIRSLPWPADAVFTVLSVSETVPAPAMLDVIAAPPDLTEIQREADAAAADAAASAATQLRGHGLAADGTSKQGVAKELIVAHANQWGADLIVVGSCQKSRVEKFILGSVSEYVVKHAPCSVLVLKRELTGSR
jgi:nucleotide-binding universal stress UspA family protein